MKIILLLPAFLLMTPGLSAQPSDELIPPRYPRLVIGIVVDQMKYDLVHRYRDKLGKGGFLRLYADGHVFTDAQFDYMPTYTGPGHASIYTGTTPSQHGIIGNYWYVKESGDTTYCVSDPSVTAVGGSDAAGRMSPRWLLTTTLADECKLRFSFKSKTFAVSIKDRGAVLPAGHSGDGAFWFDAATGNWITSTYYMNELPAWLRTFNAKKLPDDYLAKPWELLLPAYKYTESTADDVPYEATFAGEARPVFPHDLPALRAAGSYDLVRRTPGGNSLTVDMAKALIEGEKLGQDEYPDFLSVSFSPPDYIGHQFGPHSMESQDCYLRLDRDLASFFDFLDMRLDMKNVLLFMTADHGAVPNRLLMQEHRMPAGYFDADMYTDTLNDFLRHLYGPGRWIKSIDNNMVFLNHALISDTEGDPREMTERLADMARGLPLVADVITASTMMETEFRELPRSVRQRGFHPQRSGDLMIYGRPGYTNYGNQGTDHGSPFPYDTRVPLVFYGWKVTPGMTSVPAPVTGIAPTISQMLDMDYPNGCTGLPFIRLLESIR